MFSLQKFSNLLKGVGEENKIVKVKKIVTLLASGAVWGWTKGATAGQLDLIKEGLREAASLGGYDVDKTDLPIIIANLVKAALTLLGVAFLILVIWGGVMWMTSAGNQENIKRAKSILINATVGLIIVFLGYSITSLIIKIVAEATLK